MHHPHHAHVIHGAGPPPPRMLATAAHHHVVAPPLPPHGMTHAPPPIIAAAAAAVIPNGVVPVVISQGQQVPIQVSMRCSFEPSSDVCMTF